MPALPARMPDSALTALVQPLLQPDEQVLLLANGEFAPLEPHDGLTMAVMRLSGRWRPRAFAMVLSDRRLRWLELTPQGAVASSREYRLPLKGRMILGRRGVIEVQFPGEPRRFLTFAEPVLAADLYRRIDDQQQETQRAHAHVPEVVGVGVKPASVRQALTPGEHGQTVVAQHELVSEIRPSYRPKPLL